jgi:hypothetical protein
MCLLLRPRKIWYGIRQSKEAGILGDVVGSGADCELLGLRTKQ